MTLGEIVKAAMWVAVIGDALFWLAIAVMIWRRAKRRGDE
jgi:hypothetical protein